MKRSEPVELMNMCVLRRGSKVLVQDRTDPTSQALLFRAVMLKRVNPLQMPSFVRFSETGLTISSPRLCGITDWCKDGVRHVVLLYRAEQFTGTLRSSDGARSGGRSSPVSLARSCIFRHARPSPRV